MIETLIELALDESKWIATAMVVAAAVAVPGLVGRDVLARRERVLRALNLFYGVLIGVMAAGHLLAVALKTMRGTLEGSLALLVPLGLVLGVPAWWLALRAGRLVAAGERGSRTLVGLNLWLGLALLALGLHNAPLAAPAAFDLAYQFHRRRAVGWAIVAVALAANAALFVGAVVFWIQGRTFEEFSGM